MKHFAPTLALLLPFTFALSACPKNGQLAGGGALDGPTDPGGGNGALTVVNPTEDTWDIAVDGAAKGSLGPRSQTELPALKAGPHAVVATNGTLGLEQRGDVAVRYGVTSSYQLKAMVTRLEVTNPLDVPVEIAIDGSVVGLAAPGKTTFDAVPAGNRTIVARATTGPGAVRTTYRLSPGGPSAWVVPQLTEQENSYANLPVPPTGMGLVHMKNESRFPVYVFADGVEKGLVASGAWADIVLPPGDHHLEVRIEGIQAKTEHTVTLKANQSAEWIWGSEAPR